jgi:hypothetical protein
MIKTGLIGHGYWGKIIESKLDIISKKLFVQTSVNYDTSVFDQADWIIVATPAKSHYGIVKDCIEKGVNVFIEKPFCNNLFEAENLILLAEKYKINVFVDNVFLYRKELLNLKIRPSESIKFCWYKYGPFNDNLINDLLYHDLYIIISMFGVRDMSNLNFISYETDILKFNFFYAGIKVEIDYNRVSLGSRRKVIYLDGVPINFESGAEDPLKKILLDCISDKVDFKLNNYINLHAMSMMDKVKKSINIF